MNEEDVDKFHKLLGEKHTAQDKLIQVVRDELPVEHLVLAAEQYRQAYKNLDELYKKYENISKE